MRYPISIQTFEKIIEGNYVYVDKTDLVYDLAQQNVCFLSRPRRFGKSLLISTLEAYFLGRKELFKGLKMEGLEKKWETYPVFHIDFAGGDYTDEDTLQRKLTGYVGGWERIYGKDDLLTDLSDRFRYVLEQAAAKTGKKAVVLIDEYDKPLLDVLDTPIEEKNRNILKGFYGTFKAADASLRFVLLTGVTKFSQISVFSGFNQPNDISMDSHYDALCGITEEELYQYFKEPIGEMAVKYGCGVEEMKDFLKKTYDGYHFSCGLLDIYNPFSLVNAFYSKRVSSYWYRSGTPAYLVRLLEGHHVNMERLTAEAYTPEYFMDYRADSQDPLAMLYQSGYLTIKSFDLWEDTYRLDYPNDEVRKGFVTLMAGNYMKKPEVETGNWILDLNRMLKRGDTDSVRKAFTSFLSSIPYEANKDQRALDFESHFQYTFYIINRLLSCYTTLIEKQNSCGRADMVIESDNDIYIFEFKLDGSAAEALRQIEEKQYAMPYAADARKLHRIGVSVSSRSRTVEEWEEE